MEDTQNEHGGYDFELVGEMIKECECPICLMLIRNAIELPCSHILCKTCLDQWGKDSTRETKLRCPTCKVEYKKDETHESRITDRIITTSLKVKCQKSTNGCDWLGTISDYQAHIKINCMFIEVQCPFPSCTQTMLRKYLKQHEEECKHRTDTCKHCELEMPFFQLKEHEQKVCPNYPVVCQHNECGNVLKRREMESHLLNDCLYHHTDCDFKFVGCDIKVIRKELGRHFERSTQLHVSLLLKHTFNITKILESTQDELATVKSELSVVKNELAVVKTASEKEKTQVEKGEKTSTKAEVNSEESFISSLLERLYFQSRLSANEFNQQFTTLMASLKLNEYYKYQESNCFLKIDLETICERGNVRFGVIFHSNQNKYVLPDNRLVYRCKSFLVLQTGNNDYCIYLTLPELPSKNISVLIRDPFSHGKKLMALYKTAIPVKGEYTKNGCILLQAISK